MARARLPGAAMRDLFRSVKEFVSRFFRLPRRAVAAPEDLEQSAYAVALEIEQELTQAAIRPVSSSQKENRPKPVSLIACGLTPPRVLRLLLGRGHLPKRYTFG
jgi:hypothetical protein